MSESNDKVLTAVISGIAGVIGATIVSLFVLGLVYAKDRRDGVTLPERPAAVRAACGWCGRACPYCRASYPGQLGDVKK